MSISKILTAIDEYKDLAIECVLQENENVVKALSIAKAQKLEEVMILIKLAQQDAVIAELKKAISNIS
jgi:hypothetical protein